MTLSLLLSLAQQGATRQQSVTQAVAWAVMLLAVLIVATYAIVRYRKALFGGDDTPSAEDTVSLETLRRMRAEGRLTDEEYQKASDAILSMSPGSNPLRDEIERRARERAAALEQSPGDENDDPNSDRPGH